ncbi:hypothetical protein BGZ65_010939 [Modicella reniformis]|uniref:Uncharacterized protein n=1 Tax=Modicella reniformis TaxID=1440133 RepID=A0A9P6SUU5_9FUNG|nr:hypothetical protein BGZ65_010939 [Modicella reniformis]
MPTKVPLATIRILRPIRVVDHRCEATATIEDRKDPIHQDSVDPIKLCNEFDRTPTVLDLKNQLEKAGFTDISIVLVALHTVVELVESIEMEMKDKRDQGMELIVSSSRQLGFLLCSDRAHV